MTTYKIRRFFQEEGHPGNGETIITGLTLEEALEHCRRDDTHGEGWFDGFDKDDDDAKFKESLDWVLKEHGETLRRLGDEHICEGGGDTCNICGEPFDPDAEAIEDYLTPTTGWDVSLTRPPQTVEDAVFARTYDIVMDEMMDGLKHFKGAPEVANRIARRLAEEGLLIMDPLPDEDEYVDEDTFRGDR